MKRSKREYCRFNKDQLCPSFDHKTGDSSKSTHLGFLTWRVLTRAALVRADFQDAKRKAPERSRPNAEKIGGAFKKAPLSCPLIASPRCIEEMPDTTGGSSRCVFAAVDCRRSKCDSPSAQLVQTCCKEYVFVFSGAFMVFNKA